MIYTKLNELAREESAIFVMGLSLNFIVAEL